MIFWLSFADPQTGAFLGVAIVQVDEDDAQAARDRLPPASKPGAEWLIAAAQLAWDMGCNPGGEVLGAPLPFVPPGLPLNRLLTREQVEPYGHSQVTT